MKHPLKIIATTVGLLFAAATSSHGVLWVSYHDLGAATGQESTGNITTHQSGGSGTSNNALDTSLKALISYADGSPTGVLFGISGANGMDSRTGTITRPPNPGTPADPLFNVPGLNLNNGIIYVGGNAPTKQMTFTLTGLNPSLVYDLALYGDRNVASDGLERFTLGGADAAVNSSSTGILSNLITDMETRPNAVTGNVVRWTDIKPGADGTINVLVDVLPSGNSVNLAYLTAIRLEATPEPSKAMLLAIGLLGLLVRRRR